ncbi:hypothetical protein D3875_00530 [Deinococcus cavernae]|uniref:TerB family tellurite resistance protein n=1 Tax=Deinococcus cavernae TaxID=2320857 RepID=A0A418VHG2_9DEIO|nr:hypothetical protein [Deinococcus cavernae]RJF75568.1 hypothetical protein D3875_00530 [Deinococcus cavernae]
MNPAELSSPEIADLINTAFLHVRGDSDTNISDEERTALADYLGCNEDVRQEVLAAWQEVLSEEPEINVDEAEYWLDVEFIEPCPE